MLCGDIVKDDSGAYEVFTEQGWSASQMTAAKVMDVIARLPDCDGHAADAVSAYIQVKMEDASKIAQNSNVRMSRYLDKSTRTQVAKIMVQHLCVESDWPSSQTFHSSEQMCRGYFWSQPKVSTRRRVVTEQVGDEAIRRKRLTGTPNEDMTER